MIFKESKESKTHSKQFDDILIFYCYILNKKGNFHEFVEIKSFFKSLVTIL